MNTIFLFRINVKYAISNFLKADYILVIIVDKVKSYILSLNLNQIKESLYEESLMLKNKLFKNAYITKQIQTWNTGFIIHTTLVNKTWSSDLILLKQILNEIM